MSIGSIKLVCAHGVKDGEADFIERFRLKQTISGPVWVPTVKPHGRLQQLKDDALQTYPLASEPDDRPIRERYPAKCERCRRDFPLRWEKLQELMNATAFVLQRDTLWLDRDFR